MRVLFVFPDAPLSENFSGGASRFYSAYKALIKLGYEVFVWRPLSSAEKVHAYERENSVETAEIRSEVKLWQDVEYEEKIVEIPNIPNFLKRLYQYVYAFINPFDYFFPGSAGLRETFRTVLDKIKPDLVWVETPFLGVVVHGNINVPWLYENLDFIYKLKPIRLLAQGRCQTFRSLWENSLLKYLEYEISRASNFVVTGSVSDADDIRKQGQSNIVVIPTTYRSIPLEIKAMGNKGKSTIRIVHLGALSTTSNYVGLKTYLETVHHQLINSLSAYGIQVELILIGDTTNAKPNLLELISKNQVQVLGFKSNLRHTLRPFDISIIPYSENTGTRTKVPLLMNYAQVVVATENSVAGTPEVMECDGCFFTKDVNSFLKPILQLALDFSLREKMGLAAKAFFEKNFVLESQLDHYRMALDSVVKSSRK